MQRKKGTSTGPKRGRRIFESSEDENEGALKPTRPPKKAAVAAAAAAADSGAGVGTGAAEARAAEYSSGNSNFFWVARLSPEVPVLPKDNFVTNPKNSAFVGNPFLVRSDSELGVHAVIVRDVLDKMPPPSQKNRKEGNDLQLDAKELKERIENDKDTPRTVFPAQYSVLLSDLGLSWTKFVDWYPKHIFKVVADTESSDFYRAEQSFAATIAGTKRERKRTAGSRRDLKFQKEMAAAQKMREEQDIPEFNPGKRPQVTTSSHYMCIYSTNDARNKLPDLEDCEIWRIFRFPSITSLHKLVSSGETWAVYCTSLRDLKGQNGSLLKTALATNCLDFYGTVFNAVNKDALTRLVRTFLIRAPPPSADRILKKYLPWSFREREGNHFTVTSRKIRVEYPNPPEEFVARTVARIMDVDRLPDAFWELDELNQEEDLPKHQEIPQEDEDISAWVGNEGETETIQISSGRIIQALFSRSANRDARGHFIYEQQDDADILVGYSNEEHKINGGQGTIYKTLANGSSYMRGAVLGEIVERLKLRDLKDRMALNIPADDSPPTPDRPPSSQESHAVAADAGANGEAPTFDRD